MRRRATGSRARMYSPTLSIDVSLDAGMSATVGDNVSLVAGAAGALGRGEADAHPVSASQVARSTRTKRAHAMAVPKQVACPRSDTFGALASAADAG
jgi:hypothetical protein